MEKGVISGQDLFKMFNASLALLTDKHKEVDALNVFPVPDGDTGTNMYLTLASAVKEIETLNGHRSVSGVAGAAARGALMGARGNSGVILSQLLRGFAYGIRDMESVSADGMAQALEEGVKTAYKAIMKPVEGTILTVAREAAAAARKAAQKKNGLAGVLQAACRSAELTLLKTPEMLPALQEAGVIDAGGMGWLIILTGFMDGLKGLSDGNTAESISVVRLPESRLPDNRTKTPGKSALQYPYCTEVLVSMPGTEIDKLQDILMDLGDSLVIADSGELTKVHLHTAHPGNVLEACLQFGPMIHVKIENMNEQVNQNTGTDSVDKQGYAKKTGIVTVAAGSGIREIMESLGADWVVTGGQTMNPSIEELLVAVENVDAETVFILPNNKNIIITANQIGHLTKKEVVVIPTRSIPQGIAAMVAYIPEGDVEKNVKSMQDTAAMVKTGEVTNAVRDARIKGNEIEKGSVLGIAEGEILVAGADVGVVVVNLIEKMISADDEVCTLYYGETVAPDEAEQLHRQLRDRHPEKDVELHYGGQPLYQYLISVE